MLQKTVSFLKHEPCPKCGSRDNLGVYSDGHKWCFGCHYYLPPKRTLSNVRLVQEQKQADENDLSTLYLLTRAIPKEAICWLRQYGVTDEEIQSYGICWEQDRQLLVFPFYEQGKLACFNGRNFGADAGARKYHTKGTRHELHIFDSSHGSSPVCILTEDVISAIKVGRSFAAYPLLGSHVPPDLIKRLLARFEKVGVWLDMDKAKEASKAVLRASVAYPGRVFRVVSPKDPKEYSNFEIIDFIKKNI